MSDGWNESAAAWIEEMANEGDYGRAFVIDPALRERLRGRSFRRALDVGCGEGRLCRMLRSDGIEAVGLDPTAALIAAARERDPAGRYVEGQAEELPFEAGEFDLVVACCSLIDIPDFVRAIHEMARVLAPGGALLIANLSAFTSASNGLGWIEDEEGVRRHFAFDRYLEERAEWVAWRQIRIRNFHRPLSAYMRAFLEAGLVLRHFDEPPAQGGDPVKADYQRRAPWFVVMEWEKPGAAA